MSAKQKTKQGRNEKRARKKSAERAKEKAQFRAFFPWRLCRSALEIRFQSPKPLTGQGEKQGS
jgi:hypothetical protein